MPAVRACQACSQTCLLPVSTASLFDASSSHARRTTRSMFTSSHASLAAANAVLERGMLLLQEQCGDPCGERLFGAPSDTNIA